MSTTSALGGAVRRREDPALIRGLGRYVDDIKLPGDFLPAEAGRACRPAPQPPGPREDLPP